MSNKQSPLILRSFVLYVAVTSAVAAVIATVIHANLGRAAGTLCTVFLATAAAVVWVIKGEPK